LADEIVGITDAVCAAILDEEYADLARRAVAKLARKRPSQLLGGRCATWAAGVVYALGQVNFLFDPAREPCVTADQLSGIRRSQGHHERQGQAGPRPAADRLLLARVPARRHGRGQPHGLDIAGEWPCHGRPDRSTGHSGGAFQRGLIPYIRLWARTAQKLLAIRGKGTPPGASSHLPGPPDVRPATPRYPGRGRQVRPYRRALSVRWASV
jgi:hypothetical protein